ncbi:hypothetical protein HanRHA438_Chr08g0371791 [Helianthus annuus]|nr:hypothetical protein HanRHA438_Chr08g0371791 [Helianthus annuus]
MISLCLCYVCPLCAYLVHLFTIHLILRMPVVCILSTSLYNTLHAMYAHCVRT